MLEEAQLNHCNERFSREPDIVAAWIFGSAANGRFREDSDVDFALHYQPEADPTWADLGQLALDLEAILGRKPDLGRLNSRNLVYAMQAFRTGRLVYAADEQAAMSFASRLQSLYMDLKKDRKVVEEAYCA
jgi:uncharacterized protein